MRTERDLFYIHADRFFLLYTIALLLVSFGLAFLYNTWLAALFIGIPAVVVPALIAKAAPGKRLSRIAYGAAIMVFAGLHIHQAHGFIEMHFGVFVSMALLLYYRDIFPIIAATLVIAVHHLLFNYLQVNGFGVWVFAENTGFKIVLLHALFVVIESSALLYLAYNSGKEFLQTTELREIGSHISKPGDVDLTFRIQSPKGDFTPAFNSFFSMMLHLVRETNRISDRLNALSNEIDTTTATLAEGASLQDNETDRLAKASEEIVSTMAVIESTSAAAIEQVHEADNITRTSETNINVATDSINTLAGQLNVANDVIQKLNHESDNIGSVLAVIRSIAEQTNLLALNAAIEAARAGEQGRGFAVVADEVRTLASRSQNSTEEIQTMIAGLQQGSQDAVKAMNVSQTHAQKTVELINATRRDLVQMREVMSQTLGLTQKISQAMSMETAALNETNGNIVSLRSISQNASEKSAQAHSSAEDLSELANELRELMRQFRVST